MVASDDVDWRVAIFKQSSRGGEADDACSKNDNGMAFIIRH